jgi:hypothetical protein
MPKNLVSATLSPQDRDEILVAIATIKTKLPFLLTLTPEESKSLSRLGDKSRAFTAKALEIALQQSDFLPRALDIQEFQQDLALFEALYPITVALTQLAELVNDTTAVAGSEAYGAARIVYNYAKNSGLSEGLEPLIDDLGKRFKQSKQAKPPTTNC